MQWSIFNYATFSRLSGLPQKHKLVFLTLNSLQLPSQHISLNTVFYKVSHLVRFDTIFLPSAKRLTVTPLMSLPSLYIRLHDVFQFGTPFIVWNHIQTKLFWEFAYLYIQTNWSSCSLFSWVWNTDWHVSGARECSAGEHDSASARVQQANKSSWIWTNHAPAKQCDWTRVHHQHHCCVDFRWKNSLSSCLKISQTWNQINRYLYVKTSMRERIPTRARRERGTRAFCEVWRACSSFIKVIFFHSSCITL